MGQQRDALKAIDNTSQKKNAVRMITTLVLFRAAAQSSQNLFHARGGPQNLFLARLTLDRFFAMSSQDAEKN